MKQIDDGYALAQQLAPLISKHMENASAASVGLGLAYIIAGIACQIDGTLKKQRAFIESTCEISIKVHKATSEDRTNREKEH